MTPTLPARPDLAAPDPRGLISGAGGVSETRPGCEADLHDTVNAYTNHRCRCPEAKRRKTREWNRYLLRRMRGEQLLVDTTGTVRRLRALQVQGWRYSDIGARIGVDGAAVSQWLRRPRVHLDTATAVRRVYDELADLPGPSHRTAERARRRGWLGPLWWDDDTIDNPAAVPPTVEGRPRLTDLDPVAVERAVAGDRVPLTRAERIAAVHMLHDQGVPHVRIAEHLDMPPRCVLRDLNAPSPVAA